MEDILHIGGGTTDLTNFSSLQQFSKAAWDDVPTKPGVYVIYDLQEVIYVSMAGRNGNGNLRNRLKDHSSGQIVNMFAQYLFLDRVQFVSEKRITHPREAKAACRKYIEDRCSFTYFVTEDATDARDIENQLKSKLKPSLNP